MSEVSHASALHTRSGLSGGLSLRPVTADRQATFSFIQRQFCNHFKAVPEDDCDELVELVNGCGETQLAFGLRFTPETFFVRHYVGDVVERLRCVFGERVAPNNLVELSHLAASRPGVLLVAAPMIVDYVRNRGAEFLVCTATEKLQRFFRCRALATETLACATANRLPELERSRWGDYYDNDPLVMAGDLAVAGRTLEEPHRARA